MIVQGEMRTEGGVKAVELRELWRRYRESDDRSAREALVLAYAPLVKYVAGRIGMGLPAHVEEADLISYGLSGLVAAVERFDPALHIKFETYAIPRIRGSILDELRSLDWAPRAVRARARALERANMKLEGRLLRAPTDEELAAELGITVAELHDALLEISRSTLVALDELWGSAERAGEQVPLLELMPDLDALDPQAAVASAERHSQIAEAIGALPERERLVIALYYYEELTLREIGEVLGVTESRVSQMHTKAALRLRSKLAAELD